MSEDGGSQNLPRFGHKGRILPRKQKFPRKKRRFESAYEKAVAEFIIMNDFNKEVALEILANYYDSKDEKYKESVLMYWIGSRRMKERVARPLFKIGSPRYKRMLELQGKRKPGGRKPNWVILYYITDYQLVAYCNIT